MVTPWKYYKDGKGYAGMILYHGSSVIVEKPDVTFGKNNNDYGQGFYCTEHLTLAREWACPGRRDGIVNVYELDPDGLKVMELGSATDEDVLRWVAVLVRYRQLRTGSEIAEQGRKFLIGHFAPEVEEVDLVKGYRADDSYFSFVRDFLNNTVSLEQLGEAMKLGALGEQLVLKSRQAEAAIRFLQYEAVNWETWHRQRRARDEAARADYRRLQGRAGFSGRYMMDILREDRNAADTAVQEEK